MMTKLREYSKIFIIIVAVSFIGLMVFEWGMDYTGLSQRQNVVGEVNGEELSYEMFTDLYQQLYQNERSQGDQELSDTQLETIRDQVWEQFIQRILFSEEMEKLGIAVTDSEVVYQIKNYPLDEIKTNPSFLTDGEFDWKKYYASFSNPQIPWAQIEDFYRQQIPFQKLRNIVTATVRVTSSEVEEEFINSNQKMRVEFLEIPFTKFTEPPIEIADEEALDFYKQNIDDYQQQEQRKLSYVLFPSTPSPQDTMRIYKEFEDIKNRINNGEDFNDLAVEYSEDPAVETNQGRYDFFSKGDMVKPFEEAAFNGKVGELVGPVETQFGLHLINIEDKRREAGEEQVKASHILLKVATGPTTRERQETAAAFFAEDARESGFETVAERDGYKIEETAEISLAGEFIPGFGREPQIFNFAFRNDLGAISELIYTEKGYAVFKVLEIQPEGPQPFEEVKNIVVNRVKLEKQKERARNFADGVKQKVEQDLGFKLIAAQDSKSIVVHDSTDEFTVKTGPRKIGYNTIFTATSLSLEPDQLSQMIETNRGIYWQRLIEKTAIDSAIYKVQKESIQQRLLVTKRDQAFQNWYEHLKAQADIVDNRKMFNL